MKPSVTLKYLLYLLEVKRPAYGKGVTRMQDIITAVTGVSASASGNIYATHPNTDGVARTLFSCHIDTACLDEGDVERHLNYDGTLHTNQTSILGADDAAGIFIMLNMWVAGVPGTYVFHEGEEIGGIGSADLAQTAPELLTNHDRAIAFDRAGTTDIITSQATGMCCSDGFAYALSNELYVASGKDITLTPAAGIFTDTANYNHLIPECTNISVGYEFEHTRHESQDTNFLFKLTQACIAVNWDALPTVRVISDQTSDQELDAICELVKQYPRLAAELLWDTGYDAYELKHYFETME